MKRTPIFVMRAGHPDERVFRLLPGKHTIGRAPENDIVVPNLSLSRMHARLDVSDGGVTVTDLTSKNGTYLREIKITEPRALSFGDEVRCGDERFVFAEEIPDIVAHTPTIMRDMRDDISHLPMEALLDGSFPKRDTEPASSPLGEESSRRLKVLLKVSQTLASPAPLAELFQRILDLVLQLLKVDRAAILTTDGKDFLVRATSVRPGFEGRHPVFSRHIAESARDNEVAVLFTDARSDPRFRHAASVLEQSICSAMCAPLKPRTKLLGLLYVDSMTPQAELSKDDLDFLSALANQAAVALEYSMMRQTLENHAVARSNLLRFFPPAIVDELKSDSTLAATDKYVTALFADISDYTRLASEMHPRELVRMLNAYFSVMSEIIFTCGGTLEKYVGDALLAIWGAPVERTADAENAVLAAIRMQEAIGDLNSRSGPDKHIHIHIGLNSGAVVSGNIGSERYLQYATIGSAINIASRLCGEAPKGEIWLSESTYNRLETKKLQSSDENVVHRVEEYGPVLVKGHDVPIRVYRVMFGGRNTPTIPR